MKRFLLGITTLMLVGCPAPSANLGNQGAQDVSGNAVLEIVPEFRDGGYKTQAEIKNYTQSDIKRLDIELIRLEKDGETWTLPASLSDANRKISSIEPTFGGKSIRFAGLRPNTSYRVRWFAYNATESVLPDGVNHISEPGQVDVAIAMDDAVKVATMSIKLKDRLFSSTATLDGIEVIDGGYTYPGGETIQIGTP